MVSYHRPSLSVVSSSCLLLVQLLTEVTPSFGQGFQPDIFINCGVSSFFTDFQGNGWVGDTILGYHNGGKVGKTAAAIADTFEDGIYQTERWASDEDGMRYEIPVMNGSYDVVLHFAEVFLKAQCIECRVFTVEIEEKVAFQNLDIFKEAEGGFKALTMDTTTVVKDGSLSIHFIKQLQNPKICGIEIRPIFIPSVRINVGGPSYIDDKGFVWQSDKITNFYNAGNANTVTEPIDALSDQILYKTERWLSKKQGNYMVYDIPILNGVYDVSLHFAETYKKAQFEGARVFNVTIEDVLKYDSIDIFQEAGGGFKAVKVSSIASVSDGYLTIALGRIVENPMLNAIEVHPEGRLLTPPKKTLDSISINVGSSESYTDSKGTTWTPDDFYNTGVSFQKSSVEITGSSHSPDLYKSNRWDGSDGPELKYNIPASEGDYTVTLHFAEIFSKANKQGFRVFNVAIEGKVVFENVDIFATVGMFHAMTLTTSATVTDGALTIELLHVTQNTILSGIEIHPNFLLAPPPKEEFNPIRIDAGSERPYVDSSNTTWLPDAYYNGGKTLVDQFTREILGTIDDPLYHTERWSDIPFSYEVPLPDGSFKVTLHFAELYSKAQANGKRVFDVLIEGTTAIDNLDIYAEAGKGNTTVIKEFPVDVSDGALTIEFIPGLQNPKVNAIEIEAIGTVKVHQAHAVPGGPYIATDSDDDGRETIPVDGRFSHTHGPGASLVLFNWKINNQEIGFGTQANLTLPVGSHNVSLEVRDSQGDVQSDWTIIAVRPFGYPEVYSVQPSAGDIAGGEVITIEGDGFNFTTSQTTVHFGELSVSGVQHLQVINRNKIRVITPKGLVAGPQDLSVETAIGTSNPVSYTFIDGESLTFEKHDLYLIGAGPTTVVFGPDSRLYISTQAGDIVRLTLNETDNSIIENETVVSRIVSLSEPPYRVILGMTFDPMDTSEYPTIYVAHSFVFHKQDLKNSYNGKVSKVYGKQLDQMENIITGLPVSDHDHGINGVIFGNDGELYIQVGGNTNAGVAGPMSSRSQLGEGYFSAATLVAYLNRPNFNGFIEYDDSGYPLPGLDIEVFASGQRNAYDLTLHTNGKMYATDNGPNFGYGPTSITCDGEVGPDPKLADKLNLIVKDGYYGHPNPMRGAAGDPRQCLWRSDEEPSDNDYTAPMLVLKASSDGIIEYESNHFGGQLRGTLIISRYLGELYYVALTDDGEKALTEEVILSEHGGLDVTMGPDGKLYVAQNGNNRIIYLEPLELAETDLVVKTVFPRRGSQSGGSPLQVHGKNLDKFGTPVVTVGRRPCPLLTVSSNKITCTLPPGEIGLADVVVTAINEAQSSTFERGYWYISGGIAGPVELNVISEPPVLPTTTDPPQPSPTQDVTPIQNVVSEPPVLPTTTDPPQPSPTQDVAPIQNVGPEPPVLPTTTDPPQPSSTEGGVTRFVLVDAEEDVKMRNAFECSPSVCMGSSSRFNIQAETQGEEGMIARVTLNLQGPVTGYNIDYREPYTIFGDLIVSGSPDYVGQPLPSGVYSITAQAQDSTGGNIGPLVTLNFTISGLRRNEIDR